MNHNANRVRRFRNPALEPLEQRALLSAARLTDFAVEERWHFKSLLTDDDAHYFVGPMALDAAEEDHGARARGPFEYGLFRTDGTVGGTNLLKDGFMGADADRAFSNVSWLPALDGEPARFLFAADDGVHGEEIWVSDGTSEGTELWSDEAEPVCCPLTIPTSLRPYPKWYTAFSPVANLENGDLLFWSHRVNTSKLWRTNGMREGTRQIVEIPHSHHGERDQFVWFRDAFYFVASELTSGGIYDHDVPLDGISRLWRTDGTAAGTHVVADLPFPTGTFPADELTVVGEHLYVTGGRRPGNAPPATLIQSDGTSDGTFALTTHLRLNSRTPPVVSLGENAVTIRLNERYGDQRQIVLIGDDAEVTVLAEFTRRESFWEPDGLLSYNGYVYFTVYKDDNRSHELWRTDGTAQGTGYVGVLAEDSGFAQPLVPLAEIDDRLYFRIGDSHRLHRNQVWMTDGPTAELFMDEPLTGRPGVTSFFQHPNGGYYFFDGDGSPGDVELWRTDGVTRELIYTFSSSPHTRDYRDRTSYPYPPVAAGDHLYFLADDGRGRELWRSDGTTEGTELVRDIAPEADWWGALPQWVLPQTYLIEPFGDTVLYWGGNTDHGLELFAVTQDPVVRFSRSTTSVFEDGRPVFPESESVTVLRDRDDTTSEVLLIYEPLTATLDDGDLLAAPARITFLPGEFEKEVILPIIDDDRFEETELLRVRLESVEAAAVEAGTLIVSIFDNEPGSEPLGDANGDEVVDFEDFFALLTNFGNEDATGIEQGDFDGNGITDFRDFLILAENFGRRIV